MEWLLAILRAIASFFKGKDQETALIAKATLTTISHTPFKGDRSEAVKQLKAALNRFGAKLDASNPYFGSTTQTKVAEFQKTKGIVASGKVGSETLKELGLVVEKKPEAKPAQPVNPAYENAKKHLGKGEKDIKFVTWMSSWWPKFGLKNYKTIIGSSFAWCAIFFGAMNSEVGQKVIMSAGAKKAGQSGVEINWQRDGIPEGAGVWKNSSSCSSGSGNHITFSAGACTAEYLKSKAATWPALGGNQNNKVQISIYCAKGDCPKEKSKICRVFWPHEVQLPGPVLKNVNCGGEAKEESTR